MTGMRTNILRLADNLNDEHFSTNDIDKAKVADRHYRTALDTLKVEINYMKTKGEPVSIPFVADNR